MNEQNKLVQTNLKTSNKKKDAVVKQRFLSLKKLTLGQIFIGIIAISAFVIASLSYKNFTDLNEQSRDINQSFAVRISTLTHRLDSLHKEYTDSLKSFNDENAKSRSQQESLLNDLKNTLSQRSYQNDNWIFLKVRYLLELAEINNHWSNPQSTEALLQQADNLLIPFKNNEVLSIRQAIAKDISTVNSIPVLDIAGILGQLDAVQVLVDHLDFSQSSTRTNTTMNNENNSQQSSWQTRWDESLNYIGKLIIIRRHDAPIQPILSAEYESMLKAKINFDLQAAQWSVLNKNDKTYHFYLKNIQDLLKQYALENKPNVVSLINQVNTLQKNDLVQNSPSIGAALPLINKLIDSKSNTPAKSPVNKGGKTE